jgi:serine protease inhibitor
MQSSLRAGKSGKCYKPNATQEVTGLLLLAPSADTRKKAAFRAFPADSPRSFAMRPSAFVASLAVLLACLSDGFGSACAAPANEVPAQSPAAKSADPTGGGKTAPSANEHAALLAAQAKFGVTLLDKLSAGRKAGNVAVSPAGIASIFALLERGADEPMRAALLRTLGLGSGSAEPTGDAFEALRRARLALAQDESGALQVASKFVLDPSTKPYPTARLGIEALGAEVSVEDLTKPEAIARINDWVKEKTRGHIGSILDEPLDQPSFLALDALHFKSRWKKQFDPAETAPAPFKNSDGKTASVQMMHLSEARRLYRQNNEFIAIDLPYVGDRFSLVVVTTKTKPARLKDFVKVADWLSGAGFSTALGSLSLPRFSASGKEELLKPLDAMGLGKARLAPSALGGFAPGAVLSRVVQRTEITVNEEGTEAAAATAAAGTRSFDSGQVIHMIVDKPFMFALRDNKAGLVLMTGYVSDPLPPDASRATAK